MTSPDATDPCTVCNKCDTRLCNRCKSVRYCSTACQHVDWPTHKLLCATYSSFDASSRPTDEYFRAILFPVDDRKPRFVWLHCEWRDGEVGRYQYADRGSLLGPDAFPRDAPIQYNPVLKRRLSDTIYVCHRDTFLIDGSKANNSIASITATKRGQYHDWRGPIIAYGKVGLGIDPIACKDLDMTDFRHIADYFLSYGYKPTSATQETTGTKVLGVRINCIGDEKILNKPCFEAVEVPFTDAIFSEHDTSDIAERIGLPIFTQRCSPDPRWAKDQENEYFDGQSLFNNQDATFLHLCCDPKSRVEPLTLTGPMGWGWASGQWQSDVGSIIVVRQDKKPLSPLHVEALCKYCCYEIRPLLAHSIGEYSPEEPMSKDAVLAMISRSTFVIYWYKLLEEKHKEGVDTSVPYPYGV